MVVILPIVHYQEKKKMKKKEIKVKTKERKKEKNKTKINHEEVLCDVITTFKKFIRVKTRTIDAKIRSDIKKLQACSRKIVCRVIAI